MKTDQKTAAVDIYSRREKGRDITVDKGKQALKDGALKPKRECARTPVGLRNNVTAVAVALLIQVLILPFLSQIRLQFCNFSAI